MPVITLEIVKLEKEQKARLVDQLSEIASTVTKIPKEAFYVYIKENEPDNVGVGGILLSDRKM